jgi:hypothetical protein
VAHWETTVENENCWTEADLRRAVRDWKVRLESEGRTDGTIRTYLRDASAFIAFLASSDHTGRPRAPEQAATARVRYRQARPRSAPISVPPALQNLFERWDATGRPRQGAMIWPRRRYEEMLPDHLTVLDSVPDCLDRDRLRAIGARAHESEELAVVALAAIVVWGKGNGGLGPFHLHAMLTGRPDSAARIHATALTLHADGPIAAYRRLGSDCALERLGTSFGTKFLAFCQPAGQGPVALIHDDLVRKWLGENGRPDLMATYYSVSTYEAYLVQIAGWAASLGTEPEVVEYLVFEEMSRRKGNQWVELPRCNGGPAE